MIRPLHPVIPSERTSIAPRRCRNVLVAAGAEPLDGPTLLRAQAMADLLGGSLLVLRVAHASDSWSPLLAVRGGREAQSSTRRLVDLKGETLRTCTKVLGPKVPAVLVRSGSFVPVVARAAERLAANVVVLPGRRAHSGETATRIALESGRAVLVAEARRERDAIVAATDLRDERTPMVAQGACLAARLQAPLTAVHNQRPLGRALLGLTGGTPPVSLARRLQAALERARERTSALGRRLDQDIQSVIVSRATATRAILEAAHDAQADLVIVGTRPRPAWKRWMRLSVSARIVDRAERSVLVVPMGAASKALGAA